MYVVPRTAGFTAALNGNEKKQLCHEHSSAKNAQFLTYASYWKMWHRIPDHVSNGERLKKIILCA